MDILSHADVRAMIRRALREDIGRRDATSRALVPASARARSAILAKGRYVICGLPIAAAVFRAVDRRIRCRPLVREGQTVNPGDAVLRVSGPARGILAAERAALNFVQRMTGIATLARRFVDQVRPRATKILDTRKTTPGLRRLEKYAVLCGGGANHRMGLFDMALVKDNHRRLWESERGLSLADAVRATRRKYPRLPIEVEVETEAQLKDVLRARPDWVLLDNMRPNAMRRCVALARGRVRLEASGGVTLANVKAIAASGVDAVSIGGLTHSAPAADLSLEIE
ncbi:MAG: carboxylating nicotinate-nucleotide diphosphorylase [Verrucomicrobiota bacterium]|nr:carboxylating nicotinate-nucleotide diphosphorylase [Verrucomicrobiota bacterium]